MGTFSKTYSGIVDAVIAPCDIYSWDGKAVFHTENAMWDTGSTRTFLSSHIVEALKLQPYGKEEMSGIGGVVEADTYVVHVRLPMGDYIANLEVLAGEYNDYDMIIGMDVVYHGDFHLDNSSGHSVFTFRIP